MPPFSSMIGSLQAAICGRVHPWDVAKTGILPRYRFCRIRRRIMHLSGDLVPGIEDDRLGSVEPSSASGNVSRKRPRRRAKGDQWLQAGAIAIAGGNTKSDPERVAVARIGASQSDCAAHEHHLDPVRVETSSPAVAKDWCAYCLISANRGRTYVGVTSNCDRRLRQHNGELAGGAKAVRAGRPWQLICIVRGFKSYSEACQFEWKWKHFSKKTSSVKRGLHESSSVLGRSIIVARRQAALEKVKRLNNWTSLSIEWYLN